MSTIPKKKKEPPVEFPLIVLVIYKQEKEKKRNYVEGLIKPIFQKRINWVRSWRKSCVLRQPILSRHVNKTN